MLPLLPPDLTLTSLPMAVGGQLRMFFTLSLGFSLEQTPRPLLPPEAWAALLACLPKDCAPDHGLPKPQAEWLLAGDACAPAGSSLTGLPVEITVGSSCRRFLAQGDREDDGLSLPEPRPFSRMPLDWSRTAGGPDHPENPLGRPPRSRQDTAPAPLPNIVDLDALERGDNDAPACPAPRLFTPERLKNSGTYDTQWLLTCLPGPPDDFDWSVWQAAQTPQRLNGYFTGAEEIRISNMHPDEALIISRLPGKRLRLFLEYGESRIGPLDNPVHAPPGPDTPTQWHEIAPNADTLWLCPNSRAGLVFWRASAPTADERGTNIRRILAVLEDLHTAPRPGAELVLEELAAREAALAEEAPPPAPAEAPEPSPPVVAAAAFAAAPPDMALPEPDLPSPVLEAPIAAVEIPEVDPDVYARQTLNEALPGINAMLAEQGLPPMDAQEILDRVAALEKSPPAPEETLPESEGMSELLKAAGLPADLPAKMDLLMALPLPDPVGFSSFEAYQEAAGEYVAKAEELINMPGGLSHLQSMMEAMGEPLKDISALSLPGGLEEAASMLPDKPDPDALAASLQALGAPPLPKELLTMDAIPMDDQGLLHVATTLGAALGVNAQDMGASLMASLGALRQNVYSPESLQELIKDVAALHPDQGQALQGIVPALERQPLTEFFDLSSLALAAGVRGPALRVLAEADPLPMQGTGGEPPELEIPSKPEPAEEELEDLKPTEAYDIPEEAPPMSLPEDSAGLLATLTLGKNLEGLPLTGLDLRGLSAQELARTGNPEGLRGLWLENCDFAGADLTGVIFAGAVLDGANFRNARLLAVDFSGCSLAGADLSGADISGALCDKADFTGANLAGAVLRGISCRATVFDRARLDGSGWREARGEAASFAAVEGIGADFSDAVLPKAAFTEARLSGARFHRAKFQQISMDFSEFAACDFFGADLSEARLNDTRLSQCAMEEAVLDDSSWLRISAPGLRAKNSRAVAAVFEECELQQADFACAFARQARWLSCDLREARLARLDLLDGALRGSRLGDANLEGANLFNADLFFLAVNEKTRMFGADLGNTCLNLQVPS